MVASNDIASLMAELAKGMEEFTNTHGELLPPDVVKFPITVTRINAKTAQPRGRHSQVGMLVKIRPCGDEKTYLGLYVGDLPRDLDISWAEKSNELFVSVTSNPAIFVPALNRVVRGDESWWSIIEKPEDATRMISDSDIQNSPCVVMLKSLAQNDPPK